MSHDWPEPVAIARKFGAQGTVMCRGRNFWRPEPIFDTFWHPLATGARGSFPLSSRYATDLSRGFRSSPCLTEWFEPGLRSSQCLTDWSEPGFGSFPGRSEGLVLRSTTAHGDFDRRRNERFVTESGRSGVHQLVLVRIVRWSDVRHAYEPNHRTTFRLLDEVHTRVYVPWKQNIQFTPVCTFPGNKTFSSHPCVRSQETKHSVHTRVYVPRKQNIQFTPVYTFPGNKTFSSHPCVRSQETKHSVHTRVYVPSKQNIPFTPYVYVPCNKTFSSHPCVHVPRKQNI